MYSGSRTSYIANDLTPVTRYSFYLQASTEGDDSPFSNVVSVATPESGTFCDHWGTLSSYGDHNLL